jgi:hypothetical protein
MNVIMNVDEVHVVLTLVSSQVLDNVELSDAARKAIRDWRQEHVLGSKDLDAFSARFNESLGNHIDEQTTRYLRRRGSLRVSAVEERAG